MSPSIIAPTLTSTERFAPLACEAAESASGVGLILIAEHADSTNFSNLISECRCSRLAVEGHEGFTMIRERIQRLLRKLQVTI